LRIYESALAQDQEHFLELSYTIETGEAERIAVDGAAKAGGGDDDEEAGDEGRQCTSSFFIRPLASFELELQS